MNASNRYEGNLPRLEGVSRRDFMRVTKQFGLMSTLLGLGALSGAVTLPRLAEAANSTYKKRFKNKAKVTLKFGPNGMNERVESIQHAGTLHFTRDIEERTDGALRIEYLGSNQICGQLD